MKKQKQTTVKPTQFSDLVGNNKVREISPPEDAKRNEEGKFTISKAEAVQKWFKASKEEEPSAGFLGVPSETIDTKEACDNEMLYKGKDKKEDKE
jgi:hypothetical protein